MRIKPMPSKDILDRLLTYDPTTGKLYWKPRPPEMFKDDKQPATQNAKIWNSKNAGKEAFCTKLPTGHLYSSINRDKYLAHRIIWKMTYGTEPDVIDHDDGNPGNNRLLNLKDAGQTLNMRNTAISRNNTSGYNGVSYFKALGKWEAKIMVNRKTIHLGLHDTPEEAYNARKRADAEYGFHRNHGRAVRVPSSIGG